MARILDTTPEYILGWKQSNQEEENKKNSDAIADITKRMFEDREFFNIANFLINLDEKQFNRAKVSLSNLFEETFDVQKD